MNHSLLLKKHDTSFYQILSIQQRLAIKGGQNKEPKIGQKPEAAVTVSTAGAEEETR
ncbi:MAG: hypothetical protein AAFV95_15010 [Bacteroidota bacterium]